MACTLLLVDDEPANLNVLERMLHSSGYETARATSGTEALERTAAEKFDLVLLDVRMPDLDGIDVLTHLRARGEWLPVILVTASNSRDERIRGAEAGADDFLEKPVDLPVLLARVRTLLRLKEAREELGLQKTALEETLAREHELTSFITHDLKNPLAVLATNVAFARERLGDAAAPAAEALEDAKDAIARMVRLIDTLLAVRSEEGALVVRPDRVRLDELCEEVCRAHRREVDQRGLAIERQIVPALTLEVDPFLVRRTLENLLENAIRYTPERGRIRLEATRGDGVVVTVSNTGRPIPVAERERLFLKFARLDPGMHRAGRGLGLYFARRVVEAHGGRIYVTETAEWPTRFVIELPATVEVS